jgi:hypothetical protein
MFNRSGKFRLIVLLFAAAESYDQSIEQTPVSTVFRANILNLGLGYVFVKSTFYGINNQLEQRTSGNATAIIHLQLGFWLKKR